MVLGQLNNFERVSLRKRPQTRWYCLTPQIKPSFTGCHRAGERLYRVRPIAPFHWSGREAERPFHIGFVDSSLSVFLIAAIVLGVGFIVSWFIKEVPLRTKSASQEQAEAKLSGMGG